MYGTMYGVKRTTVYLPEDLKARLEAAASKAGATEAEVIREALEAELRLRERPPLRLPLFESRGSPSDSARRVDEILAEGFGRD